MECVTVTEDIFGIRTQVIVESAIDEIRAEVATGYVTKKLIKRSQYESCKIILKAGDLNIANDAWLNVLSCGGLFVLWKSLADFVCNYFAILDFVRRQTMFCSVMDQNLILAVPII